jgi:hypothetical protein
LLVLATAAALGGCGSSRLPDILGGGDSGLAEVRGTVERVDSRAQVVYVDSGDDPYRTGLRDTGELALHYDDRTVVVYAGRNYRPVDLERGDRVAAEVERRDDRLLAREIEVLHDISGGGADISDEVRGVVRHVDTRERILELERATYGGFDPRPGEVLVVHYDASTTVEYRGQRYQPENLERGDEVEIEVREQDDRLIAEAIVVVADVRGGASGR